MKAHVEAYGCTLNFGESREIEELLEEHGWELVDDVEDCDLAVLVTCVVIETTERAMLKRIAELSNVPRLVISGCMATSCRQKAESIAPKAQFVAPGDLEAMSRIVEWVAVSTSPSPRSPRSYSIVPIATGCVGDCSYCITRMARGKLRSRSVSDVVNRVTAESKAGPREIQLTAQDTAAYGLDRGTTLSDLVREVCALPTDFRLRIGMMNPRTAFPLKKEISEIFLRPKVFKFLHLPVQSASDDLLESMARGYTVADFESIVKTVRSRIPEVSLSTDIIVGYPGETKDDHWNNLELIRRVRPDIVNVTRFSSRPGTRAANADRKIVGWMAKDRSREITELRFEVAKERNEAWVGRQVVALATERGKGQSTILRSDEYKQIVARDKLDLGVYYRVSIDKATPTYLIGSIGDKR